MATLSSHVLDSVIGTHAAGIRVQCFRRTGNGGSTLVFDVAANEQGRIAEEVDLSQGARSDQYELVFHASEYYASNASSDSGYQIMQTVVLRLDLPDASGNYHLPIMLSPHAYSVWWSGAPPENN